MKQTARYRKDFWFFYHFIPRHIKCPDYKQSKYYDRFPIRSSQNYKYDATIDDPFMIELASEINKKIGNKSDKYKAGYILKLVQHGYTYQSDTKTYGSSDKNQFPVCTSLIHIGDCEDGAFLGAGLSTLCGLDQAIIYVYGHMAYGVQVNGFGWKFSHEGKKYLWCETTSVLPIGMHSNELKVLGTYTPTEPPEDFIYKCTEIDDFDKYPLN